MEEKKTGIYTFASVYKRYYNCYIEYLNKYVVIEGKKYSKKPNEISDEDWKILSKNRCSLSNYTFANILQKLIDKEIKITQNNKIIARVETIAGKYKEIEHVWIRIVYTTKEYIYWDISSYQLGIYKKYDGYPSYSFSNDKDYIIDDPKEDMPINERMKILNMITIYREELKEIPNKEYFCELLQGINTITNSFIKNINKKENIV